MVTCRGRSGKLEEVTLRARARRWRVRTRRTESKVVTKQTEYLAKQFTRSRKALLSNSLDPVAEPALSVDLCQVVLVVVEERLQETDLLMTSILKFQ